MENLHNNSHIQIIKKIFGHSLSKKKQKKKNKSIINPSKTNHKNQIIFTQFSPLIWELFVPFKWLNPIVTETTLMLLITPSTHQLVLPATWINWCLQPMKFFYFFKELLLFNTTYGKFLFFWNDRIFLIFNVLLA